MKGFLLAAAAALSLSGCTTLGLPDLPKPGEIITAERCVATMEALDDAEAIARFIADRGIAEDVAREVADYVARGRLAIKEVCDALAGPPVIEVIGGEPIVQPPEARVISLFR